MIFDAVIRDSKGASLSRTLMVILGLLLVLFLFFFFSVPALFVFQNMYQPKELLQPRLDGVPDPGISAMLLQINESEIYRTAADLERIPTRAYGSSGNREAAEYLEKRLSEYPNLSVELQGGDIRNIIATHPGRNQTSGRIVLVGAHYDSISSDADHAPGVTDNACGVAIVMELARVMSQYEYPHTLQFAFWNGEEVDVVGSTTYAREAKDRSLDIRFTMNYDSSCYDPYNRSVVDVMYNVLSRPMAEELVRANTLYGINATLTYNLFHCINDQGPFWLAGYPSVMTHSESHGYFHTPKDTLDKASFSYARMNAQLGLAVLARYTESGGLSGSPSPASSPETDEVAGCQYLPWLPAPQRSSGVVKWVQGIPLC
jgi:hypothetical protein